MAVPGTYMLTYTKVDTAGNTGSVSRTVTVLTTFVNPIVGFTGPGG